MEGFCGIWRFEEEVVVGVCVFFVQCVKLEQQRDRSLQHHHMSCAINKISTFPPYFIYLFIYFYIFILYLEYLFFFGRFEIRADILIRTVLNRC